MTDTPHDSCKLEDVITAENGYIDRRRSVLAGQLGAPGRPKPDGDGRVGLALSGGGIRSATTNLGILQTLAELRLLAAVDYLCTVSGGGYIGGCLSSLLSLNENTYNPKGEDDYNLVKGGPAALFDTTQKFPLSDKPAPDGKSFAGAEQVAHLRTHGSFLIARAGLLKRDALRAVGNLFSGITFTVVFVALALLAIAAFVMAAADSLSGGLAGRLEMADLPNGATATMLDRLSSVGSILWGDVGRFLAAGSYQAQALVHVTRPGIVFALIAFVALATVVLLPVRFGKPAPGESSEDKRERRCLLIVTFALLGAVSWFAWHPSSTVAEAPSLLVLFLPAALLLVTRITSLAVAWLIPWLPPMWRREIRSVWGAFQAITMYGVAVGVVFAILPIAAHVLADYGLFNAVGALISLVAARGFMPNLNGGSGKGRLPAVLFRPLLGLAVWLFLLFALLAWSIGLINHDVAISFTFAGVVGRFNRSSQRLPRPTISLDSLLREGE